MRPYVLKIPMPAWFCGLVDRQSCDVPIYSYGVMLGISFIVGWYLASWLAQKDGLPVEKVARLYVRTAVGAIIGARVLYFVANPDRMESPLTFLKVWEGGLVAYGGFIGGLIASTIFCRMNGISLLQWADCAVPSLGTGLFFTRIGCFLYGCDFGGTTDAAWAVRFPRSSPAWHEQVRHGLIDLDAARSLPIHPTQLYESLFGLGLFALAMLVRRYRRFSGEVFLAFFATYGVVRSYFETLRVDPQRGGFGPLTTSQWIGLTSLLLAIAAYVVLYRRYRANPSAARLWELAPAAVVAPARKKGGKRDA
ncbi:MAG: prolipoprotein diacylglyceryl transferase [Myxococcota bacterium]